MNPRASRFACSWTLAPALVACASPPPIDPDASPDVSTDAVVSDTPPPPTDSSVDAPTRDGSPLPTWCARGADVPGAVVPPGFCMREFARVNAPRVLTFAPNGDLFVGAPLEPTPGLSGNGPMGGSIVVFSDDDRDGVSDTHYFLTNRAHVHGLAFIGAFLYFTDGSYVYRLAYATGQRAAVGAPEMVATFEGGRWTHGLAATPSGILYATASTSGVSQCDGGPLSGEVSIVDRVAHVMTPQARGFRNPMYMRCHFRDETCIASELGEDETRGTACSASACGLGGTACAAPRTDCGGLCVDAETDAQNCGRCGNVCAAGMGCVAGTCRAGCAAPRAICGGVCVDLSTNPQHCGACGAGCRRGAREKLVVVRAATSYGYPCCHTQSVPGSASDPRFNCAMVQREEAFFNIGETPFGLDWERGLWPAPYTNALFVGLHGSAYRAPGAGAGSRVTFIATDPTSHAPMGESQTFVDGWGPTGLQLRRAADVAFARDGRLFVSDDVGNRVYWIAPTNLQRP